MKMDMVNFTVQSLRPHLLQQAIQYERAKFQAILEKLPTSLDYTSTWLQGAVQELSALRVQSDANTQNSGQAVPPPGGSCPHKIAPVSPCAALNLAYLHLLSWEPSGECYPEVAQQAATHDLSAFCRFLDLFIKPSSMFHIVPQTVQMDRLRIELLGQTLKCLVLEAAVLLVTSTQCGGALFSAVGFVDTLKQTVATLLKGCHESAFDLKGALLGLGEQVQKIVNSTLIAQGGGALPPEQESLLKGQVAALAEEHNPVRALVGARVRSYLQALLGQSVAQRATPVPPALALMENELAELGTAFVRIVNFNRQVFGPYYSAILKKLIPPGEPDIGMDSR
ncbi:hypothetical protein Z043_111779 [Scleropages formosus]|uniref:T-complex protein 11-like protein 1-like n=1 Tax=Scleropages formosus TaxID=113540 RepID=A0A0P7X5R5_SCLFO|nr:hypothetical protein Z043_111779 [Scleropages formosus]